MISKDHKKHSSLAKAPYGNFGFNEWALIGAECETIKSLADTIMLNMSPAYGCSYIDSRHTKPGDTADLPPHLASGASAEFTDHIQYQQFNFKKTFTPFQYRQLFSSSDLILVNGNHHQAAAQVLIIDEIKKTSLQKRLPQLTNVQLILLNGDIEVFDFIKEAIPHWQQITTYSLHDREHILSFFRTSLLRSTPTLNGLVLAGGKSERMGKDKSKMNWFGQEQRYHVADMLGSFCKEVFISCKAGQQQDISGSYKALPDTFTDLGPYGAILSAFREQPYSAWLVIACDLPLLNTDTVDSLIHQRKTSKIATSFQSPHDSLPEPLITIWEPKAYPIMLSFLSQGISCPRKVLINNDIQLINTPDPDSLINVNTPADAEQAKKILERRTPA